MKFSKYHALGNDYIVVDPKDCELEIDSTLIKLLCNRHYGFGSDGVLYGPLVNPQNNIDLRIFNPDGSEAEKSGNGLRVFCRYLWDRKLVGNEQFLVNTKGGLIKAEVYGSGTKVSVEMGQVSFTHDKQRCHQPSAEFIAAKDRTFEGYRANVGNPHLVIPLDTVESGLAKTYGSIIENDLRFANRTNVQFMQVLDRNTIQIEIWERGAGYTLASGSSSTASAAVAYGLGLCDADIDVNMPGGTIQISLDNQCNATMTGGVCKIGEGKLATEALAYFDITPVGRTD